MKQLIILILIIAPFGVNAQFNLGKELTNLKKSVDKKLTDTKKSVDKKLTETKKNVDRELTDAKKKTDKGLTETKKNVDTELTKTKSDIDRELTDLKNDIARELTDYKYDLDHNLTIAREDIQTEWNYFWATVCGENEKRKAAQRKFDQGKITQEERDSLFSKYPAPKSCGFGVSVNSDGQVVLTDESGNPSEIPVDNEYDDLPEILDWNRRVEMEEWEKSISDKYVAGWLISPDLRGGITWFSEAPGPITKSNTLRPAKNGHPMVGARRVIVKRDNKGNETVSYRLHKGTDYDAKAGEVIYAGIEGQVTVHPNSHNGFTMIRITNHTTGHRQETFYVRDTDQTRKAIENGVKRGDVIGVADNLSNYSGYKNVPNHVHVNYISPEGIYIAPNNKFAVTKDADWVSIYCEDSSCLSPNNE